MTEKGKTAARENMERKGRQVRERGEEEKREEERVGRGRTQPCSVECVKNVPPEPSRETAQRTF